MRAPWTSRTAGGVGAPAGTAVSEAKSRQAPSCGRSFRRRPGLVTFALAVALGLARQGLDVDDARPRLHHAGDQRVVLPEGMALEVARQVDVAQVGVAGEPEAVHLP